MRLPLLAAILLALPRATPAQPTWREVGTTRTGNPVFVDARSIRKDAAGIIHAKVRVAYVTPVKTPKGPITAARATAMFDCARRTFATKENATYLDEKAGITFQRTVNRQPGFGPAIAGNFADVALRHLCAP